MNYPNGVKKDSKTNSVLKKLSHKNRGMTLESDINSSNEYYRSIDKAYIYIKEVGGHEKLLGVLTHKRVKSFAPMHDKVGYR